MCLCAQNERLAIRDRRRHAAAVERVGSQSLELAARFENRGLAVLITKIEAPIGVDGGGDFNAMRYAVVTDHVNESVDKNGRCRFWHSFFDSPQNAIRFSEITLGIGLNCPQLGVRDSGDDISNAILVERTRGDRKIIHLSAPAFVPCTRVVSE